jgi:hypothetical protein
MVKVYLKMSNGLINWYGGVLPTTLYHQVKVPPPSA